MYTFQKTKLSALLLASTLATPLTTPLAWSMPNTVDILEFQRHARVFKAVRTGNIPFLTQLCQEKFDFNQPKDLNQCCLLDVAFEQNNPKIVTLLLENGAQIKFASNKGQTALLQATLTANIDYMEVLLKHQVDVNYSTENGSTPLTIAIARKNRDMMRLLFKYNVDCNTFNGDKITPLMQVVDTKDESIILDFLKYGADTTLKNKWGQTAFDRALENSLVHSATLLKSSDFFDKFAEKYFLTKAFYEQSKPLYHNKIHLNEDQEISTLQQQIADQKQGLKEPLQSVFLESLPSKSIFMHLRAAFYEAIMDCINKSTDSAQEKLDTLRENIKVWLGQHSISEHQAQVCRQFFTLEKMQEITHSSQETVKNAV